MIVLENTCALNAHVQPRNSVEVQPAVPDCWKHMIIKNDKYLMDMRITRRIHQLEEELIHMLIPKKVPEIV